MQISVITPATFKLNFCLPENVNIWTFPKIASQTHITLLFAQFWQWHFWNTPLSITSLKTCTRNLSRIGFSFRFQSAFLTARRFSAIFALGYCLSYVWESPQHKIQLLSIVIVCVMVNLQLQLLKVAFHVVWIV